MMRLPLPFIILVVALAFGWQSQCSAADSPSRRHRHLESNQQASAPSKERAYHRRVSRKLMGKGSSGKSGDSDGEDSDGGDDDEPAATTPAGGSFCGQTEEEAMVMDALLDPEQANDSCRFTDYNGNGIAQVGGIIDLVRDYVDSDDLNEQISDQDILKMIQGSGGSGTVAAGAGGSGRRLLFGSILPDDPPCSFTGQSEFGTLLEVYFDKVFKLSGIGLLQDVPDFLLGILATAVSNKVLSKTGCEGSFFERVSEVLNHGSLEPHEKGAAIGALVLEVLGASEMINRIQAKLEVLWFKLKDIFEDLLATLAGPALLLGKVMILKAINEAVDLEELKEALDAFNSVFEGGGGAGTTPAPTSIGGGSTTPAPTGATGGGGSTTPAPTGATGGGGSLSRWEAALVECAADTVDCAWGKLDEGGSRNLAASATFASSQTSDITLNLTSHFCTVAIEYDVPVALVKALASRETNMGTYLGSVAGCPPGFGDFRLGRCRGFGILQVDDQNMTRVQDGASSNAPFGIEHIRQAMGIFRGARNGVITKHAAWADKYLLKGACVAYNSGVRNVETIPRMDIGTSGNDYGADVMARAHWFYLHTDNDCGATVVVPTAVPGSTPAPTPAPTLSPATGNAFRSFVNKTFSIEDTAAWVRDETGAEVLYQAGDDIPAGKAIGDNKIIPNGTSVKILDVRFLTNRVIVLAEGWGWTNLANVAMYNETLGLQAPAYDSQLPNHKTTGDKDARIRYSNYSTVGTLIIDKGERVVVLEESTDSSPPGKYVKIAYTRYDDTLQQYVQDTAKAPVWSAASNFVPGWADFKGENARWSANNYLGQSDFVYVVGRYSGNNKPAVEKLTPQLLPEYLALVAAAATAGHQMKLNDGFRSYAEQKYLFDGWQDGTFRNEAAEPGTSNHQNGIAIDINTLGNLTALYNWTCANGPGMNWVRRVVKEPHHWEYRPGHGLAAGDCTTYAD